MSKLLQKILSAAIFPAALVIVGKIVGMMVVNAIFGLDWAIQTNTSTVFSIQIVYPDLHAAYLCNSYSNLFVIILVTIGVAVLLFQNSFLNESHQNPKVLVKLVQFDFLMWMSESAVIFPRLGVWIAFHWVITAVSLVQAVQGTMYPWVATLSFIISITATWLAIRDLEREIRTILPEHGTLKA